MYGRTSAAPLQAVQNKAQPLKFRVYRNCIGFGSGVLPGFAFAFVRNCMGFGSRVLGGFGFCFCNLMFGFGGFVFGWAGLGWAGLGWFRALLRKN